MTGSTREGDQKRGWKIPQGDEVDQDRLVVALSKKRDKSGSKAKVVLPDKPVQRFNSTSTIVRANKISAVAVDGQSVMPLREQSSRYAGASTRARESSCKIPGTGVEVTDVVDSGDSERTGASRRKLYGMKLAAATKKMSHKLVKETKKKTVAREKAEDTTRKDAGDFRPRRIEEGDDSDSDGAFFPEEEGWLMPETRPTRRKALAMRGERSQSVERLENDDENDISRQRSYVKTGRRLIPRPWRRKLIEDRQELVGILNMPRNKRMRKAGVSESHLAILADVYKEVIANAIRRNQEDAAGAAGNLVGSRPPNEVEKGVRVSSFAATLGISPLLFMREMLWASNHLYAHAVPGEMNRATWIFGCISVCLMTEKELVEFAFRTCKATDKGDLEMGELDRLAKNFHLSNAAFWTTFSAQLSEIACGQETGEVVLDLEYFFKMHHKFPMIMYPALRMQELVQRRTLGLRTWGRLNDRLDRYVAKQKRIAEGGVKPSCLCVLLGLR